MTAPKSGKPRAKGEAKPTPKTVEQEPKKRRTPPDWERIEEQFRAGQMSLRTIAEAHGITEGAIRKRAKAIGWQQDLSHRVRNAVRTAIVRKSTQSPDEAKDEEVVGAAAAIGVALILGQQKRIGKLQGVTDKLVARLDELMGADPEDQDKSALVDLTDLKSAADVLEKATRTTDKLIQLERQAFNLGDSGSDDVAPVPPITDEMTAREAAELYRRSLEQD